MTVDRPAPRLLRTALVASLLALAACNSKSDTGPLEGAVSVAVTDAPSDEVAAFVVEAEGFQLQRLGGAIVPIQSDPLEVDLSSLRSLSQLLSTATVPASTYLAGEITLDFTNASVVLHGQTTPATLLDASGAPLTGSVAYPLLLPGGSFVVSANSHVLIELDVDLDQSLVVDSATNTVWFEPVLVMRVEPAAPKELLAIGTLAAADDAAGTFSVQVETFGGAPAGTLDFVSTSSTVYHVDGGADLGDAGLALLAALPVGASIQVACSKNSASPTFTASTVLAGTGTINSGADVVDGWVLARSAGAGGSPVLTVRGFSVDSTLSTFQFGADFSVTTAFGVTRVILPGTVLPLDLDDVNVGQRVRIFGVLTGTDLDASMATDVVTLWPTRLFGVAAGAPAAGTATMDLARVGPIDQADFTWADSGAVPTDPMALSASVGSLGNGLSIGPGTTLEVEGFMSAVDATGEDAIAIGLTNLDAAPTLLFVRDLPGGGLDLDVAALTSLVQLTVTGVPLTGEVAALSQVFLGSQPLPTTPTPALEPEGSGLGVFLVYDGTLGTTRLHTSFGAFAADLASAIAGGASVRHVAGVGTWDPVDNRLATSLASAGLE